MFTAPGARLQLGWLVVFLLAALVTSESNARSGKFGIEADIPNKFRGGSRLARRKNLDQGRIRELAATPTPAPTAVTVSPSSSPAGAGVIYLVTKYGACDGDPTAVSLLYYYLIKTGCEPETLSGSNEWWWRYSVETFSTHIALTEREYDNFNFNCSGEPSRINTHEYPRDCGVVNYNYDDDYVEDLLTSSFLAEDLSDLDTNGPGMVQLYYDDSSCDELPAAYASWSAMDSCRHDFRYSCTDNELVTEGFVGGSNCSGIVQKEYVRAPGTCAERIQQTGHYFYEDDSVNVTVDDSYSYEDIRTEYCVTAAAGVTSSPTAARAQARVRPPVP